MKTVVKRLYEGMFLVDSALAASDWDGINAAIKTILEKAEAEIISIRKWNECRLAYEINRKSRGTYILTYFRVDGDKISGIERDVQLSERLMRVLILNAEHMTQTDVEKDTPATLAEKKVAEALAAKELQLAESQKSSADSEVAGDEPKEIEAQVESSGDEVTESATTAEPETQTQLAESQKSPADSEVAGDEPKEIEAQVESSGDEVTESATTAEPESEPEAETETPQGKTTAQQDEPDKNQPQED